MYILGVSPDHNASCALLKDGKVIACVSEERFNRIKNFFGIPKKSIEFCLKFAGITAEGLSLVVVSSEVPPPLEEWGYENKASVNAYSVLKKVYSFLIDQVEWRFPLFRDIDEFVYKIAAKVMKGSINKERVRNFREVVNVSKDKFIFVDHHKNHALTALFGAPFLKEQGIKELLVITADAEGDGLAATVSVYRNGIFERIGQTSLNNSVGNFYSAVTKFLGMKPGEHEYKVMGLAPYAPKEDTEKVYNLIKDWIIVDKKNLRFKTIVNAHQFLRLCHLKLSGKRFDHIAAAAQKLLEERVLELILAAVKKTGIKTVAVSGGVFMNVKMNKLIAEKPAINKFFVFPSCGDESNAFGACYMGFLKLNPDRVPLPIKDLYLGPSFEVTGIRKLAKKIKKIKVSKPKNIEEEIAKLLAKGEIVARFEGRSEWGARALGNRSILADPSNIKAVEEINKMIKNRDFWMPFAPIILDEDKDRYLKYLDKTEGYYMMMAYDTREDLRADLVAAIHPYDKTARAQILPKEFNPKLWEIINKFKKLTGRGVLLNTSFNIHGEPIVGSPEDAIDVLQRSGLKFLALGPYILSKF